MTRKLSETKPCSKCREDKELDEYYSSVKTKASGEIYTYYNPECKECTKKRSVKWAAKNPELIKASKRKYNKTEIGRAKVKAGVDKNRKTGHYRNWQNNNKDKLKGYNKKYSNKKHKISKEEWEICKAYFDHKCAYCGLDEVYHKKLYKQQLHKEHVIHQGRDDIKNCVPSCRSCNSSKHIYTLNQWYNAENPVYTRERYLEIYQWIRYDCKSNEI